jgi:sec-independent protein translocase protein TatA
MGTFSIWHWLIVLAVVLVLFGGRGKISSLMGDVGKGIKSFRKGLNDGGEQAKQDGEEKPDQANAKVTADDNKDKAASA